MDTTSTTAMICRSWWNAWTTDDRAAKQSLLAEHLAFRFNTTPQLEGREAFLSGESWPSAVSVLLLHELYNEDHGMHLYEADNQGARLRVAEHFVVADGQIHEIDFITDTGAYPAFIAGNDAAQS